MHIQDRAEKLATRIWDKKTQFEFAHRTAFKFIDYLYETSGQIEGIDFAVEDIQIGNSIIEKINNNHEKIASLIESLKDGDPSIHVSSKFDSVRAKYLEVDRQVMCLIRSNRELFTSLEKFNVNSNVNL